MNHNIQKTIVVNNGIHWLITLIFTEQSVQNAPSVSVCIVSAKPCTIMGEVLKEKNER